MKITGRNIEGFINTPPPSILAVLVFGPDRGLGREYANRILSLKQSGVELTDLTAEQVRKDPTLLADAVASLSLLGGEPVVRVRDCTDSLTKVITDWLASLPSVSKPVVFEAGELAARSKLRALFESSDTTAAIGCYPDEGASLVSLAEQHLKSAGVSIERDALNLLVSRLGMDRQAIRLELDKVALYGSSGDGPLTVHDIELLSGDVRDSSLDELCFAVTGGDFQNMQKHSDRVFAAGANGVQVLRSLGRHISRLHWVHAQSASSGDAGTWMRRLKPPVFFKYQDAFAKQLRMWDTKKLDWALNQLLQTEVSCKSGISSEQEVVERCFLQLASLAGKRR